MANAYKQAGVDIEDFTFTVQKPGAKTVEIEPQKTGNRWYIEVEDIVVAYWDDDCVITVTNEAGDSFTITGSVLAYAKRGIQGTMNEDQRNMFKAMIKYNEAADDLFFGN